MYKCMHYKDTCSIQSTQPSSDHIYLIFHKRAKNTMIDRLMDLTACQPTWVMLCRNELCQKIWKKRINKMILSVDSNLNMMKFKQKTQ